jgi:glycosyltransferase domain-containing protein
VNYTLIIPTFNRPALLAALLTHLRRSNADFAVIVLDSSAEEVKRQNALTIAGSGLNVSHQLFPESTIAQQKWAQGFHLAATRYASLCADDDILFLDGLQACVAALEKDSAVTICDGVYLKFEPKGVEVALQIEYDGPSVDQESLNARMSHRLNKYEATTYAVFRTEAARKVFDGCMETPSPMFWELFTSLAPLGIGKHKRLPCVYLARSAGPPFETSGRKQWHPQLWVRDNPEEMLAHFLDYLKTLAAFISRIDNTTITWRDVAIYHKNFFKNAHVELRFNRSGDPEVLPGRRPVFDSLSSRITAFRRRLIVEQGDIYGHLGISTEIPSSVLDCLNAYCSTNIRLASVWEVMSKSSLTSRLARTYRIL